MTGVLTKEDIQMTQHHSARHQGKADLSHNEIANTHPLGFFKQKD